MIDEERSFSSVTFSSGDDICSVPKMWFNQNTARNSSTIENGVVSYLLPISGRYGNTIIFSGVRVHLKKLPLTTPSVAAKWSVLKVSTAKANFFHAWLSIPSGKNVL